MPDLKHQKTSFLGSTAITIGIVAMLILSGPSQAVMVRMNTIDMNNRQIGETGVFYVNVTIGGNERIPLANISVEGLPRIPGSPDEVLVFNMSDFGTVGDSETKGNYNITLIHRTGWVSGYGYGYGYDSNNETAPYYGYGNSHQFYGYGYGYGSESSNDFTELRYKIAMNTTGASPGIYHIVTKVNTGQGVIFQGESSFVLTSQDTTSPGIHIVNPSPVLKGSLANLTANIVEQNPDTYRVYKNGTLVAAGSYQNNTPFNVSIDTAQVATWNYTVWANDTAGNENSKSVLVRVIAPVGKITATVVIKPETLNLASRGKFTAFISLPDGYDVADIDVSTVMCNGARAVKGMVSDEDPGVFVVKFNRQDLVNVGGGASVTFTVTGKIRSGGGLIDFEGSDTIRVKQKGKDKESKEQRKLEKKENKEQRKLEKKESKEQRKLEKKESEEQEKLEKKESKEQRKLEKKESKEQEKLEKKESEEQEKLEKKESEEQEKLEKKESEEQRKLEQEESEEQEKLEKKDSKEQRKLEKKGSKEQRKLEKKESKEQEKLEKKELKAKGKKQGKK